MGPGRCLGGRTGRIVAVIAGTALGWTMMGQAMTLPDGLYAIWETNHGNMTGELYYVEAPMTVANFVGLAEGDKLWIEEGSGRLRNHAYFDGQIVNRVAEIPFAIIQTGSQNGTNSGGGPGYQFRDEFDPSLRHDEFGIVSMANSGPNSNDSQYFFTTGVLSHLDDVHNVFGKILGGGSVLATLASLPRTDGKPTDDVIFHRVEILRLGASAQSFDASAQGLPVADEVDMEIAQLMRGTNGVSYSISYQRTSNTFFWAWVTDSLTNEFMEVDHLLIADDLTPQPISVSTDPHPGNYYFSTMFKVTHPDQLFTPPYVNGLHFIATDGTLDIEYSSDGSTGTITVPGGGGPISGTILDTSYVPEAYRSILSILYDTLVPPQMRLTMNFTSAATNTYTAQLSNADGSLAGSFGGSFTFAVEE